MTRPPATILVVDDEAANRKLLEALLRPEGYLTLTASSGQEALACVAQHAPDLILLDIMMPGMDGYEVADRLKSDGATAHIPIVMLSAHLERSARLEGLRAGAEDFLTKPVDRSELWLRVRNLLRLKDLSDQLQSQSARWEGQVQERTADLQYLAHYDPLTGLANRMLFSGTLTRSLSPVPDILTGDAAPGGDAPPSDKPVRVAVLVVDLDHFKVVNETFGRMVGDELLRQVSDRLLTCVAKRDTVGRLGGDQFALTVRQDDAGAAADLVADRISSVLRTPFDVLGHQVSITASIGVTVFPQDATEAEVLLGYADAAMYRAKQAGRDTVRYFTARMSDEMLAHRELHAALRQAVENKEFVLFYQPKLQLGSGRIVGAEALLRWQRPGYGLVSPEEFIPALEETGLIVPVGRWVIQTACRQIGLWARSAVGPLQVSVNVSARQFLDGDLASDVSQALLTNQVPADLLELELTESSLMADTERTLDCLRGLKRLGVQVSVDDFGTGYSCLTYLRRFPIDKLKIDRSFVRDVTTDPDDAVIALTIIRMAHSLRLDVVAEGVETPAQLAYLRQHRCDQIQGYVFSRPVPAVEMERLVVTGAGLPSDNEVSGGQNTLLVVDPDPQVLAGLQRLLGTDGYHLLAATSVEQAFDLLARHTVQVVVSAQALPSMPGTDFLDRVKDLHPGVLRIVLSGSADTATILAAVNRGAIHRYYTKPWDDGALRTCLRDAFRDYWLRHEPQPAETEGRVPVQTAPGARRPAVRGAGSAAAGGGQPE